MPGLSRILKPCASRRLSREYAHPNSCARCILVMKLNIPICCAVLGLALFGLSGCETVVEEPAVTTTTQTTETTEVRRGAPAHTTTVIRED